jgi:hypothetical protein
VKRAYEWMPCEHYEAYEAARYDADLALADWNAAPCHMKREAFAVYRAAADRENAAAFGWQLACEAYDAAKSASQ